MDLRYELVRDGPVASADLEGLRASVGWDADRAESRYDEILARSYTHYAVHSHGRLIAFVSVLSDGIADAFLLDLMVHPDFQRQGIGRALVRRAVSDLTAEGIRAIQVTFAQELEGFYRKCGFHVFGGGIIDNGPRARGASYPPHTE